jgi:Domain of unknown function (DUF6458)
VRGDDQEDGTAGIGASIFLIAVGAILAFAVTAEISGIDIQIVGWILMAAGGLGLLLSLIFWGSWGGWWRRTYEGRDPYDDRAPPY